MFRIRKMAFCIRVFPLVVAFVSCASSGPLMGPRYFETRPFCGTCHVMRPYSLDAVDPQSTSLAAVHTRPNVLGQDSCYACHATPGMLGWVHTKVGGAKHVVTEVTLYASSGNFGERGPPIRLQGGFDNAMCTRCHDPTSPSWISSSLHQDLAEGLQNGSTRCLECHNVVHPRAPAHGGKG